MLDHNMYPRLLPTFTNGSGRGSLARFNPAAGESETKWRLTLARNENTPSWIDDSCEGTNGSVLHIASVTPTAGIEPARAARQS